MYDEVYENEVVETETNEVVTSTESEDYAPAPVTAPTEIIVPETTASESHGPNKALIAFAVGGGLLLANKARKKLKPIIEASKAKKEAKKKQEFMDMLIEAGVVQKPAAEPAKAEEPAVVDVPATEVKTTEESTEETPKDNGKKKDK